MRGGREGGWREEERKRLRIYSDENTCDMARYSLGKEIILWDPD